MHSKRYHQILLPHPHNRFNSLKGSHTHFQNNQTNLVKRHSLDSRPNLPHSHKNSSFVENVQDYHLANKNWSSKQYINRIPKTPFDGDVKVKYFWRGKHGKSNRKDQKIKVKKVKRNWSELGKQFGKKYKNKDGSKSKYEDFSKINISDRFETKHEGTHGKSNQSYKSKREQFSGERMKMAKSLLNSTMLTKRQEDQARGKQKNKYQDLVFKLKDILQKYERKVRQLKDEKQIYKQKLRKERKKKI